MSYKYQYLVNLQYLGFRLHGWQKQPTVKTVHLFVDKTMKFVCKGIRFKTLGIGRTDAKVSATDFYFQLFIDECLNESEFLELFNFNSPADLRVLSVEPIKDSKFNIIQQPKVKEYRYYFSYGKKNHPYAAPYLLCVLADLDVEKMKEVSRLFEGKHDFTNYCTKPSPETKVERTILSCVIEENKELTASFFPKESYVLIVRGEGFLRNQIRLIMGALIAIGRGEFSLDCIKSSLNYPEEAIGYEKRIAPASGLHMHRIDFLEK